MHLVEALACGVRGADSGYAKVLVRGTSSYATWYSAFEGGTGNSSGENIPLDEYGGAAVYVDQVVDVRVYTSAGELIRAFTSGTTASAVEVRSSSFTGTDYETGASGASKPTTLAAVLDLVVSSFGTTNWHTVFGGSDTDVEDATGAVTELFFNVKVYGAEGDGVTDDLTALAAAVSAADAAGGGIVLFPQGTYRITNTLTVPEGVSLVGVGIGVSIVTLDHATQDIVSFSAGTGAHSAVTGLSFAAAQANSNSSWFNFQGDTRVRLSSCEFDMTNLTGACCFLSSGDDCEFSFCSWKGIGEAGLAFTTPGANTRVTLDCCRFTTVATALVASNTHIVVGRDLRARDCFFNLASLTSGSGVGIGADVYTFVSGTRFVTGGATTVGIRTNLVTSTDACWEIGNYATGGAVLASAATSADTDTKIALYSRDSRKVEIQDDSASLALTVAQVLASRVIVIKRTTNADQTVSLPTGLPNGLRVDLVYWNESAGNIAAVTFSNAGGGSSVGINQNLAYGVQYVYAHVEAAASVAVIMTAPNPLGDP